ncbi:MAG TPA: aminoacyl-tRNA hydrolase [Candidatus Saccharimonadales bacterium]|jgi:PTH1 family peptidyl-tRNA hydrolase|nr:aminoacyl-tRNA hydrolase [Candidatus Saccharimonadales bacterium]
MKLIIGLGNPGPNFVATRHNLGFMVLGRSVHDLDATFSSKPKFHGDIAEAAVDNTKVIFLRPTTFYNDTGLAVRAAKDFYKIDNDDILVVHDELALPFGTLRTREQGSHAGNNGIKSISAHIGEDYRRLRIGIWNELREQMDDADFVLAKFSPEEREKLPLLIDHAATLVEAFIAGGHVADTFQI